VGTLDLLLGGDAWPPSRLPPATARPPPAAAPRASTTRQPGMGGLLVSFGDALGGQGLAQPGMLVVHAFFPSCRSACFSWRHR
jgi:hypothetical protein